MGTNPTISLTQNFSSYWKNHYLMECEASCAHNVTYNEICVHHFEYKSRKQRMEWKHP